jgi:alpha-D-ribose 1-methylphosphonate 5-triphosphate synthase subunit PhnH
MHKETSYDPVHEAQRHFRQILNATARPGTLEQLRDETLNPVGLHGASALVAFTLLNGDVRFYVDEAALDCSSYLLINTSSQPCGCEEADYLFFKGSADFSRLRTARVGTLEYPEQGATVIVDVQQLHHTHTPQAAQLLLSGPGVDGECTLFVTGLQDDFFQHRAACNQEYPLGIDVILTDVQGHLVSIPRTTRVVPNN